MTGPWRQLLCLLCAIWALRAQPARPASDAKLQANASEVLQHPDQLAPCGNESVPTTTEERLNPFSELWANSVAICAIARMEHTADVREWLAYHRCSNPSRFVRVWGPVPISAFDVFTVNQHQTSTINKFKREWAQQQEHAAGVWKWRRDLTKLWTCMQLHQSGLYTSTAVSRVSRPVLSVLSTTGTHILTGMPLLIHAVAAVATAFSQS